MSIPLDDDLIWSIAMINASDQDFDKQQRLTTTRVTSQVCRRWREVVLGSSSVWGRLILLNNNQSTEWVEEVLKRAGNISLLWVELDEIPQGAHRSPGRLRSILSVIVQDWSRIEVLDILSTYEYIWMDMAVPNPVIRSYRIIDSSASTSYPNNLKEGFIGSNAPQLRDLACYGFYISPNYVPTWVSHLDSLHFSPRSLDDISNILIWAPQLKSLGISAGIECFWIRDSTDGPKLASMGATLFPRLKYMEAKMSLKALNALWSESSASPAKNSFIISVSEVYTYADCKQEFQEALLRIFDHNDDVNVTSLEKTSWSWNFIIQPFYMQIQTLYKSPTKTMEFDLKLATGSSSSSKPFLLKCFTPHLKRATDFFLDTTVSKKKLSSQDLGDALLGMTEATTITVNDKSLQWYNKIEGYKGLLFPNLKMVKCLGWAHGEEGYMNPLLVFLKRRAQARMILPCIHAANQYTRLAGHIENLNHIPGVRWISSDEFGKEKELYGQYI